MTHGMSRDPFKTLFLGSCSPPAMLADHFAKVCDFYFCLAHCLNTSYQKGMQTKL